MKRVKKVPKRIKGAAFLKTVERRLIKLYRQRCFLGVFVVSFEKLFEELYVESSLQG